MKLKKRNDPNGSFVIGNSFAELYLGRLSGDAVRMYVYLRYLFSNGLELYPEEAAKTLRLDGNACLEALRELKRNGAIDATDEIIITADSDLRDALKKALERDFNDKEATARSALKDEYTEVIRTINDEFFGGSMNATWFSFLDKCKIEYGFMPETIYLLFKLCKKDDKPFASRASLNYISKVAANWFAERVVTPEDVDAREKRFREFGPYADFVARKIGFSRPWTEQEKKVIETWLDGGITREMLAVLLDDTGRVSAFTVRKIDGEVKKWTEAGLKNPEEVKNYYEALAQAGKKGGGQAPKGASGNKTGRETKKQAGQEGHFDNERNYSGSFFEMLEQRDKNDKNDKSDKSANGAAESGREDANKNKTGGDTK
ncbi:MAG: DnaD domain protein [Clostridia bacterium]|nr:DnaD domain protein [Clostridia bacterium]MBP5665060.1 DnaD domain protein [Clostridia bacterium]